MKQFRTVAPPVVPVDAMGRREMLKLCAHALSGAALAPLVSGCAMTPEDPPDLSDAVFEPVNTDKLHAARHDVARALLRTIETAVPNETAMKDSGRMLRETGLWNGALYGAVDRKDGVGHTILFHGGDMGSLQVTVLSSDRFTPPLLVSKGLPGAQTRAYQSKTCMSHYCTNNTDGEHAFRDYGADETKVEIMLMPRGRRDSFTPGDVDFAAEVIGDATRLLVAPRHGDLRKLGGRLEEARNRHGAGGAYVSATDKGSVVWYDWLLTFSNGASALIQLAKGDVKPFYRIDGAEPRPDLAGVADIQWDRRSTNDPERHLVVAHVTARA